MSKSPHADSVGGGTLKQQTEFSHSLRLSYGQPVGHARSSFLPNLDKRVDSGKYHLTQKNDGWLKVPPLKER
jgi:hypothetical protein